MLDRNLGAYELKNQLSLCGLDVTAHDEKFDQLERDPWIFYWAGKNDYVMVTSDLTFKGLFTHLAAIRLGRTAMFSFTAKTYNSQLRGQAFLKAKAKILRMLKHQPRPFLATIQLSGDLRIDTENPAPQRKRAHEKDWESYERVCKEAGVDPEQRAPVPSPAQP